MNPEDLPLVRAAYAEALELPAQEWEAFLRLRFADRPELGTEVRRLVDSYRDCGDFLSTPLAERIMAWAPDLKPRRLGPYELLEPLGRGGSATVYLARRADDLYERKVAIKTLNRLSHSEEVFRRFQREIQLLARVEHPYIVRLIDADATYDGVAYIVTEFVQGVHLDKFSSTLSLREKLRLFSKVCEGVSGAHRNLVVHRDLKPSNILVMPDGTPKLLDFGIAVLLDEDSSLTETGLERMTVYYASPEQLRGEKSIATATDVYSLGVLLYELISGSAPYDFPKHELALRIQSEDPIPLKNVSRELRAIVQKAMQKEPGRRYESVDRLRDDIARFLDGYPVIAHGDRASYRLSKFAAKHWLSLSAAICTMLLLAALSIASIASSRQARRQSIRIRELLSKVLDDVAEEGQHQNSLRVRRVLEETRLKYLTSLGEEYPSDPQIAKLRFNALRGLGNIRGVPAGLNLGETARARDNLEGAVHLGEEILKRWRGTPGLQQDLALAYIEFGTVLLEMDRPDAARSQFDRADALSASTPNGSGTRPHLEALAQRSRILNLKGKQSEALALRLQVIDGRREIFNREPEGIRWEYAGALCSYGELLREMNRYQEAAKYYAEALPIIEELVRLSPGYLDNKWNLARENQEYARALLGTGDSALAGKHLDRAIALYREVKIEEPDAASNQRALAVCLELLGTEVERHGDSQRGCQLLQEAHRMSEEAARRDPASGRAQRELASIRENLERTCR